MEYIDIKGFEGLYKISESGIVLSIVYKNHRILKCAKDKDGYLKVCLRKNNKNYEKKVHRLVAEHFICNDDKTKQVNHIDYNKENNHKNNLEWVNSFENQSHRSFNKKHSSIYTGVSYHKANKKWIAHIGQNLKHIYLGIFESELQAYNARLNFIKENNVQTKYL